MGIGGGRRGENMRQEGESEEENRDRERSRKVQLSGKWLDRGKDKWEEIRDKGKADEMRKEEQEEFVEFSSSRH